jgi:ribose/xylose/arabinose/galactoside ABC-type transport system permease subunit
LGLNAARFFSLLFAALALAPALAHLLELPNKIGLSRDDYLIVQQIYRGWALLGFVVAGALLSTLVLMIMVRGQRKAFVLTLVAFLCIVGTQVVFWTFTYPANRQTDNWTVLPQSWMALRAQWEYSHAASAVLNLIALIALILSVLVRDKPE